MKMRNVLIAVNTLLVVALAVQLVPRTTHSQVMLASWKDRPDSLEATTDLSDNVVTAKVVRMRPSEIVTEAPGEPGGKVSTPVEVITMQVVDQDAKGNKKAGDQIEVFHTGRSNQGPVGLRTDEPKGPPPPKPEGGVDKPANQRPSRDAHMGVVMSAIMDDPGYKVGEEYVLFLREGPALNVGGQKVETQAAVSPEGRWRKDQTGKVQPMSDKPWAQQMRGKSADELKGRAAQHAQRKSGGKGAG